jgi:hypothetical protein
MISYHGPTGQLMDEQLVDIRSTGVDKGSRWWIRSTGRLGSVLPHLVTYLEARSLW